VPLPGGVNSCAMGSPQFHCVTWLGPQVPFRDNIEKWGGEIMGIQNGRLARAMGVVLAIAIVMAVDSQMARSAETKTLEGIIGDAMCGVKHQMGNIPDKECAQKCVSMGSKYALIVGDKVYELDGKSSDLEKLAGAKAKVTGSVDGNKIKVTAVAKAG